MPKCTEIWSEKVPRFVKFGANLTQFGAKLDTPDVIYRLPSDCLIKKYYVLGIITHRNLLLGYSIHFSWVLVVFSLYPLLVKITMSLLTVECLFLLAIDTLDNCNCNRVIRWKCQAENDQNEILPVYCTGYVVAIWTKLIGTHCGLQVDK